MRGQSAIISTVLLSGIILAIVTATFVWGQPLIQKTTDKVKIDSLIDDLTIIKEKIDHTQQTGSPSVISLNIQDASYDISEEDNSVIVKTTTRIPVITSYAFVPISYIELAYETALIDVNTSPVNSTVMVVLPTGYDGGPIHMGNTTLNSVQYNVTVYNTSNTVYDHACIYIGEEVGNLIDDCSEELGSITKNGIDYTVSWIETNGEEVILSGGIKENIGVLGSDPQGIISGKSQPVAATQHVTLKLSYRGLKDATNREYKTFLECETGCKVSDGIHRLRTERTRVERTPNATYYYVKVYFE